MLNRSIAAVTLFSAVLFSACQAHREGDYTLDQLGWMKGKWEAQMAPGLLHEEWTAVNDKTWKGFSYIKSAEGDTVFQESIELKESADGLYYIPTVATQNDGKPVQFKAIKLTENEVVFENKAHDYPQRIMYFRRNTGNITAVIEGLKNGKEMREEFPYYKKK